MELSTRPGEAVRNADPDLFWRSLVNSAIYSGASLSHYLALDHLAMIWKTLPTSGRSVISLVFYYARLETVLSW